MALTQGARNKIKSIVQSAKKLLMKEFESQLQQYYGIRPDGSCLFVEELTSREASVIETARLLRQRLHYLEEGIAGNDKAPEAVQQLVREQAFTILNRFAAVRMSEERNIIRESIRNGYNSEGFLVYDQLTGGAKTAEQFTRYNWYIGHVFDELAIDLPAVFDRFSPYALLFPSEKVLLELLDIINDEDLNIYREAGHQPINLWTEDETIGWIYQYYNSREEISEMREASGAPRNSRELAVRNQFFTPRYVVQFLVDNSLGRQWFEMTKGQTSLIDSCQYMIKREQEIFLEKGEENPEAKIEGANYIECRALKDPREILMLDPACGSMHFGLYCFDLFEQIYLEAWDNHPELMTDLRDKYMRNDFIKRIPGYILRYNIHGVDIDPRAIQIAGLSLWLRAQKSYDKMGLQPADRPAISKSNLVIAEPMPGDVNLLSEFTKSLPGPIGKLVRVIWDKMQLAGETGFLLKIEEELKKEIEIAKEEYKEYKDISVQSTLFDSPSDSKAAEMAAIYGKGQKITKDFFDTAEEEVLKALKGFAENAEGEDAFQKLLFAEDTARGFAFIELCRKRYDVIVMNPPFGSGVKKNFEWQKKNYPLSYVDLLSVFVDRGLELSCGFVSAITSRNILIIPKLKRFRKSKLIPSINYILDLGWPVMDDATVQSAAYILDTKKSSKDILAINRQSYINKETNLINALKTLDDKDLFLIKKEDVLNIPDFRILYQLPLQLCELFSEKNEFGSNLTEAKQGLKPMDDFRFVKGWVEIPPSKIGSNEKWRRFAKGGGYSLFIMSLTSIVNYYEGGAEMQEVNRMKHGQTAQARQGSSYYYRQGGTYSIRTKRDFGVSLLAKGFVIGGKGVIVAPKIDEDTCFTIGLINSTFINFLMKLQANDSQYDTGILEKLPFTVFGDEHKQTISKLVEEIAMEIISYHSRFETSEYFRGFEKVQSINQLFSEVLAQRDQIHEQIKDTIEVIDSIVDEVYNVDSTGLIQILSELTDQEINQVRSLEILDEISDKNLAHMMLSFVIGIHFNRFDDSKFGLKNSEIFLERNFDFISDDALKVFSLVDQNIVSNISDICTKMSFKTEIVEEALEILEFDSLTDYLISPTGFFDHHLKEFTLQRKVAPMYWPLSTRSNSFVVLVYYHGLNDTTLYSIVNELVDPKIKEIAKEVEVLDMKGSAKELNDQKEFLAELEDFKEELLQIAQLPYKPNQDDGVLITAAPLRNLFQHTKWKKSAQDCWKKLEKGEYDWANLAYGIWPERVKKKCVKDLSLAIAHGLEEICEVKPKERAEKQTKEIKAEAQLKI